MSDILSGKPIVKIRKDTGIVRDMCLITKEKALFRICDEDISKHTTLESEEAQQI